MGIDVVTLAVAKKYTKDSVAGAGALAGVPCQIQSKTAITGGTRITFLWEDNNGDSHTTVMDVMNGIDGQDGKGIQSVSVNDQNHLIITYTDGTVVDAGQIDIHGSVDSVNGQTGVVVLDAEDVGALPANTPIPSKTSDLTNDSGFATTSDVSTAIANKLEKVIISDISQIPNNDIKDLEDGVYTIILGVLTNPNLLNAPPISSGVQLLITTASSGFRYFNCLPYNNGLPIYFGGLEPNGVIIGWRPVVVTSNRNLLDNPWFTVNQRGITSWSNEGVGYSADRWKHDGSATGNITNGVYTCNVPTYQTWEDDRITPLLGKTVTLSWILSDGSIGFETKTLPSALTSEYVWPFTNSYVVLALKSGNLSQAARIAADVAVKAVKLELGKVSTLAMDTAPNYATELLKCQRYFYRFKSYTTGISGFTGFSAYDGGIRFMIPLPVAMRIYPTITTSNVSDWGASQTNLTGAIPATTVKLDGRLGDNNMSVTFENSSYAVSKAYLMYAIASNAYMDFSADL